MSRGKHFNHKEQGHEPTVPKHGLKVPTKNTEYVDYEIETVADENNRPVSIKTKK